MADVSGLAAHIERKEYHTAGTERGLLVLRDLRITVAPGEFVCILGPSGCGKSTLMNILARLDTDYAGEVETVDGASRRLGVMFQTPRLMPWLSVRANLELIADPAVRASERIEQLLRAMRLDAFAGSFPGKLSGGMQRRVSLARACLNRPDLLLLDEPFVSLDAPTAAELRAWLLDEWREARAGPARQSVLCLTHDLREALVLADRILFLSARPAHVVLEERIDLPRPRDVEDGTVAALREALLRERPSLLAGDAASGA